MNRCHCQSPPVGGNGGSWRGGSPAASLSQPGMPDGVLDLYALRSGTVLLQRGLPDTSPAPTVPCCQPSISAEPGGPARSPGPAMRVPPASLPASRDGSIFPFGHFSGTIWLWRNDPDGSGDRAANSVSSPAGKTSRFLAGLLDLWPAGPLRRSFSTHPTTKVSLDDKPRIACTDSPLFLR